MQIGTKNNVQAIRMGLSNLVWKMIPGLMIFLINYKLMREIGFLMLNDKKVQKDKALPKGDLVNIFSLVAGG